MFADDALTEIEEWRQQASVSHFQLDWRWIERYRELSSYDSHWWLASAGPFYEDEQHQWNQLRSLPLTEVVKEQMAAFMTVSRQRELDVALAERRQPRLQYPAIEIEDVRHRIVALLQLDEEISRNEPNALVRKFYHQTIAEEEVYFLRLIEATYEGDTQRFWDFNKLLLPTPSIEEMNYALSQVKQTIIKGLKHPDAREVSEQLQHFLQEHLHLSWDWSQDEAVQKPFQEKPQSTTHIQPSHKITAQTARRFFDAILHENGYEGWRVCIDASAGNARIEQGLRHLYLPNTTFSLEEIRHLLSHELVGHISRCIAGEHSRLGLLGIHTKNSLPTEEGLALYHERRVAALNGNVSNDLGPWLGTLATGLASGVLTQPQTFLSLFDFFELLFWIRRLLQENNDPTTARQKARKTALSRCLRTYRGVPDLEQSGVCYMKDALYLSGLWQVERAVAEDETVLDRLAVGVVALEQLSDLQELGIVSAPQPLRTLVYEPDIDTRILSFENEEEEGA